MQPNYGVEVRLDVKVPMREGDRGVPAADAGA